MRDKYRERAIVEKMRMLNEILSATTPNQKRAVVTRFNPHFYLLFQGGVKCYEEQGGGEEGLEERIHNRTPRLPTELCDGTESSHSSQDVIRQGAVKRGGNYGLSV